MATNDNMTGNFTVLVDKDGILTGPFTTDGTLDFISKNNLATDAEVATAKQAAIAAAKTETESQVSAAKTTLTTEINKKVNTSDYNSKVSGIESSISSIETTINKLNDTYATDNELKSTKTELESKLSTLSTTVSNNTTAIAAINNTETGIFAQAKAYTDAEVDKLEASIEAIQTFSVVIPEDEKLPETGKPKTIYLIPEVDDEGNDLGTKEEYLWIDGKFELIGTTHVSLDGYAKTEDVNKDIATAKQEAIDAAKIETTSQVNAAKEELTDAITEAKELITVTSTVDIGGIKKDTAFTNKTNAQLWDELLNKELFPTLTGPSSSFSSTVTGLKEVGEVITSIKFTSTFNRGSINPQYKSETPYRAGLPTNRAFEGTDLAGNDTSDSLTIEKTISSYTVVKGVQSWGCTISYGAGTQPKTNKGGTNDANGNKMTPLPAGTLEKKSVSITGTYPFFATTSSITATTKQSLVNLDSKTIKAAMVGCTDTNFWVLEVPACWTITNVTGAASGQLGGNATNAVKQWTQKNKVKTINNNNIKYYRYEYGADNAPKKGADTLTFSIKYDRNKSLSTSLDEGATWEEE